MTINLNNTLAAAVCGLLATSFALAQTPSVFPPPPATVSTIPANGDVNPYGVSFVPRGVPDDSILRPGDVLVSNYNNSQNLQGTGSTIVRVNQHGQVSTFFQGGKSLGLTAALGVVQRGFVFVGSLPTADGTSATVQPGSLIVLNRKGVSLGALTDPNLVNGPWGMAINDQNASAQIFFSNILNGTVTRLDVQFSENSNSLTIRRATQIAAGYNHRTDPAALVLGPSGLFYDAQHDILYVASSADNAVYAVQDAGRRQTANGTGTIIYQDNVHLHGPIDLIMAPNGHLIVANGDGSNVDPNQPSELVEFTVDGKFVAQFSVDLANGGAFGLGVMSSGWLARYAAVDDVTNTLMFWTEPTIN